jgi:hypothetical protein
MHQRIGAVLAGAAAVLLLISASAAGGDDGEAAGARPATGQQAAQSRVLEFRNPPVLFVADSTGPGHRRLPVYWYHGEAGAAGVTGH